MAGELVAHVLAETELPALAALDDRDRLLAAAWSARRPPALVAGVAGRPGLEVLGVGRVYVDLWVRAQQHRRRRRCECTAPAVGDRLVLPLLHLPLASELRSDGGVTRPRVDPDYTATVGLSREQGRALTAVGDTGPARFRSAALIRLLLYNPLRVDETLGADFTDLGSDRGHQVLTVLGKGNRRAKVPLSPATLEVVHAYLDATRAGLDGWRGMGGPLLATTSSGRMRPVDACMLGLGITSAAALGGRTAVCRDDHSGLMSTSGIDSVLGTAPSVTGHVEAGAAADPRPAPGVAAQLVVVAAGRHCLVGCQDRVRTDPAPG